MVWVIGILFALLSGVLLSGRGGFLIAGYNTASKEEKEKYDEKKLCRITGAGMAVITGMLFLLGAFEKNMPYWMPMAFMVIICVDIVVMLILLNTKCTAKPKEGTGTAKELIMEKPRMTLAKKGSIVFTVVIFAVAGFFVFTGDVQVKVNGDTIEIQVSYWPDKNIDIKDIESVTYAEDVPSGRRTNGFGGARLLAGHFRNSEYGDYLLYAYNQCSDRVVMETVSGIVAVNGKTEKETKELYDLLENSVMAEKN